MDRNFLLINRPTYRTLALLSLALIGAMLIATGTLLVLGFIISSSLSIIVGTSQHIQNLYTHADTVSQIAIWIVLLSLLYRVVASAKEKRSK